MQALTRRSFLSGSVAVGTCLGSSLFTTGMKSAGADDTIKDDISIAQWALVREVREGKWKTSDFPRIAREDFDINGIEFVSTLFEVPTFSYLKALRRNAERDNITMVLIMVDDEGETCTPDKDERIQTAINHRKWVEIAAYLGCHAIRTNCRGPRDAPKHEALEWAADSYNRLLEYAAPAGIRVLIENHGGFSNDADWMVSLFRNVDHPSFGSYPDWRMFSPSFDNLDYVSKMLPYAGGMSYRNQPTEAQTAQLIRLCQDSGYRGWYGIESSGREEIRLGKRLLEKYLLGKS